MFIAETNLKSYLKIEVLLNPFISLHQEATQAEQVYITCELSILLYNPDNTRNWYYSIDCACLKILNCRSELLIKADG